MAATLEIINNFSIEINGIPLTGKQGTTTDDPTTAFTLSINGQEHHMSTTLLTATVVKAWDKDTHQPTTFQYVFFWADQDVILQFVGTATNYGQKVKAKMPFVLSFNGALAAANTTDFVGGAAPTLETLDHINVCNYSGNTANYVLVVLN